MFPRALTLPLGLAIMLGLSGCGKTDQGSKTVAMKDLEVVDGTATDAMTDLDGVRTEGTTTVPTGDNAAVAATPKKADNASAAATNDADANAEAVPDQ